MGNVVMRKILVSHALRSFKNKINIVSHIQNNPVKYILSIQMRKMRHIGYKQHGKDCKESKRHKQTPKLVLVTGPLE